MSRLVDLGYAAGWRLVRALPEPAARVLFEQAADIGWRRDRGGARQLTRNLRRVVGAEMSDAELAALARQGLRHYARYWMEAFRLPSMSRDQVVDTFHIPQRQILADAVAAGKGLILALPHMGNWDHAGAWVTANGWPLTTVAERLKPESVFERFVAYREKLGMEILPLTGGAAPPLDVLSDRLRAGHVVPLLADRDLSARGVRVEFFGEPTRMPAGPAVLALRTGAPLYAVSLWHEPGRTCAWLDPVSTEASGSATEQIGVITQRVADAMARRIAEHPADWHMLQRLWLADLRQTADRPVRRGAAARDDG